MMRDPVRAADGHVYERLAITRWFAQKLTSPMTGAVAGSWNRGVSMLNADGRNLANFGALLAAAPRAAVAPPGAGRDAAAATTWIFRGALATSRPRGGATNYRGRGVDSSTEYLRGSCDATPPRCVPTIV